MSTQAIIVAIAKRVHCKWWRSGSNVSKQTHSSSEVCKAWQEITQDVVGKRVLAEYPVVKHGSEKFDLVDVQDRVAYELKVSENNPHHEFYRDIFKVAVHNDHNARWRIKKLVFLTPKEGARKLGSDFGAAVRNIAKRQHGIEVEICGI